jgi:hypothetical protein
VIYSSCTFPFSKTLKKLSASQELEDLVWEDKGELILDFLEGRDDISSIKTKTREPSLMLTLP